MSGLTWRAYRDPERGAAVVARLETERRYRFTPVRPPLGDEAVVTPFVRARGLLTGRLVEAAAGGGASGRVRETLPSAFLAEEPFVLEHAARTAGGLTTTLAVPRAFRGDGPNAYLLPRLLYDDGEPALLVPTRRQASRRQGLTSFVATALGEGLYQIPAGYYHIASIVAGGERFDGRFSFDPYHGVVYLERRAERAPLSASVAVEVGVRAEHTHRLEGLGALAEGEHPIVGEGGGLTGLLLVSEERRWHDVRRLPEPAWERRASAVDTATYDGAPVATSLLWRITTDADEERLARAVREALPAGSLYRRLPMTPAYDIEPPAPEAAVLYT